MKLILLSLHDVTPAFEKEIDLICGKFDSLGAVRRSLLVVPDYQRKTPVKNILNGAVFFLPCARAERI